MAVATKKAHAVVTKKRPIATVQSKNKKSAERNRVYSAAYHKARTAALKTGMSVARAKKKAS